GKNLTSLRITNELYSGQKAKTLVVGQHHAREQITVEVALRFILYLLNAYGEDEAITEFVDTVEIFVIPTVNPDGLDVVVNGGNHWLRKNLRPFDNDGDGLLDEDPIEDVDGDGHITGYDVYTKTGPGGSLEWQYDYFEGIDNDGDGLVNEDEIGLVDLNRNYAVGWGNDQESSSDPLTQTYRGESAFSEPETTAFRDFALDHKFAMAYALHSGINTTFFPTAYSNNWVEPSLYSAIVGDLRDILPPSFNEIYTLTEAQSSRIMTAPGGFWGDWMYSTRDTPVPITFEIYHNGSVEEPGAFTIIEDNSTHQIVETMPSFIYDYFAPSESRINDLWDEIRGGFDYLLEMTPRLEVSGVSISGGVSHGDSVSLGFSMTCHGHRLGTIEDVELIGAADLSFGTWDALDADETISVNPLLPLPFDLVDMNYTVRIGNDYTGYAQLVISLGETSGVDYTIPIAAGIGIIIVAVVIVLILRRIRT
ncbi:MAG: M14 family zinc carboxypeptidase, partial [Candidatus Thorarchaeota archaeon]